MSLLPLKLACWDYDRTRPLMDGRIRAKGISLEVSVMRPQQAFQAILQQKEFHVAEMSLANFTALKARGECPLVGIPVMLSKMFRHSCIYVRKEAGIRVPADLKGKRAGTAQFTSTGVVYVKGMLEHDFGVNQRDMNWWIGGLHSPVETTTSLQAPAGVQMQMVDPGQTLAGMFRNSQLDVIFSNHFPAMWNEGWSGMERLFPTYKTIEQDYYRRTGIFPVMHTVVIREDVHRENPYIASSLYQAFCEARDLAVSGLYDTDALRLSLPWLIDHIEETRSVMGQEFFSYGVENNRPALSALSLYLYEQGLAPRVVELDELFVPV